MAKFIFVLLAIFLIAQADPIQIRNNYSVVKYSVTLSSFHIHNGYQAYKGTIEMDFVMHERCAGVQLVVRNKYLNIELATYQGDTGLSNFTRGNLTITFSDDRTIYQFENEDQFAANSLYTIKVNFTSLLLSQKKGFYVTNYRPSYNKGYYAIIGYDGGDIHEIIPFYDEPNQVSGNGLYLTVSNEDTFKGVASGQLENGVYHIKCCHPRTLFGLFVSEFLSYPITHGDKLYTIHYTLRIRDHSPILAIQVAYTIIEKLERIAGKANTLTRVDYILLPDSEPHVLDTPGLVYFQGPQSFHGVNVESIVMFSKAAFGEGDKFPLNQPDFEFMGVHRILLMIVEKNIQQFVGFDTRLHSTENIKREFWIQDGIVQFLKYKMIDLVDSDYTSMQWMYLDYVQPFLWRNIWHADDPLMEEMSEVEAKNKKFVAMLRMYHDFWTTTSQEPFNDFLKSISLKNPSYLGVVDQIAAGMMKVFREDLPEEYVRKWIEENDYPLVTVSLDEEEKIVSFTQSRFRTGVASGWLIPLAVYTNDGLQFMQLGSGRIGSGYNGGEILLNSGRSRMYRVNYSRKLWQQISELLLLNHERYADITRAQLIDDAMVLAFKGTIQITTAFNVAKYMSREKKLLPWAVASKHFKFLYQRFHSQVFGETLRRFLAHLTEPAFKRLDETDRGSNERILKKELRNIIIDLACMVRQVNCVEAVQKMVENLNGSFDTFTQFPANTRDALCCAAIRHNSTSEFSEYVEAQVFPEMAELLEEAELPEEKGECPAESPIEKERRAHRFQYYLRCLSCSRSARVLQKYIQVTFNDQGGLQALRYVAENADNNGFVQFLSYLNDYGRMFNSAHEQLMLRRWLRVLAKQFIYNQEFDAYAVLLGNLVSRKLLDSSQQKELLEASGVARRFNLRFYSDEHLMEWLDEYSVEK